jgi:hypothetical protein
LTDPAGGIRGINDACKSIQLQAHRAVFNVPTVDRHDLGLLRSARPMNQGDQREPGKPCVASHAMGSFAAQLPIIPISRHEGEGTQEGRIVLQSLGKARTGPAGFEIAPLQKE